MRGPVATATTPGQSGGSTITLTRLAMKYNLTAFLDPHLHGHHPHPEPVSSTFPLIVCYPI